MVAILAPTTRLAGALLRPPVDAACTALIGNHQQLSYADLNHRVGERIGDLDLPERSLVALAGTNTIEHVVTYLAILEAGHVPILAGEHTERITANWPVGAVVTTTAADCSVVHTGLTPPALHPDLALLVSTSGSTGCPKLVRLSHRNLVSNALAIADSLALTEHDRGITSLPLDYCFGLSVLHSHLAGGASMVITDTSVVDLCFRRALQDHAVTNLAGVPHTYELLERSNPESLAPPSMRLLTQAGGRLAPAAVWAWSARAERWGAEFVVMYGQTEATARMACLPSHLARRRAESIGRPIPGGSIELRPVEGQPADVGEIVYRGPNVMMGYAASPDDLGLGHTLDELVTGDLARHRADDDVYEIVGRRSRFVKPFGLRIDLDHLENGLRAAMPDVEVAVAGDDHRLVAAARGASSDETRDRLAALSGLPRLAVDAVDGPIPLTASGKVDYAAVLASCLPADDASAHVGATVDARADRASVVGDVFGSVLGRDRVGPDDTFVSLGGDSLSYVECSIRLEAALGHLPHDWHLRPVASLAATSAPGRRFARMDTTVLLRAIGICLVVATHMRLWHLPGGAHTLLAVAGYNLARFMAPLDSVTDRVTAGLRTAGRAAVPTMIWIVGGMALFGSYGVGTLLLVNNYAGGSGHDGDRWHFWFIEVFVHLVLLSTALLAVPALRRIERRFLFLAPVGALAITLVLRMEWSHMDDWYNLRFRTHGIAWFFVLGWLIQRSVNRSQRIVTTLLCVAVVPGFFNIAQREWRILAMLLLLVWVRDLPVPRAIIRPIGVVAAASMWIYVSHFSIWPVFAGIFVREVAYVCTIAAGVGVWFIAERLLGLLNTWRQGHPRVQATTPYLLRGSP